MPANAAFRAATLRHVLTHTAGVRAVRRPTDLLRPALGWSAPVGRSPSLAEYYRGGLRVDFEPGTNWAYSNHGFATLGQIVEDVSGLPLERYLRERVFTPLGGAAASGLAMRGKQGATRSLSLECRRRRHGLKRACSGRASGVSLTSRALPLRSGEASAVSDVMPFAWCGHC